ncbi:MAG: HAMP domain-containing histidine kinase [Elusimicrobia bacterium]|nr:HAMP domain-containing histidine kinase [Elusimicrobiota bacterium]
MTLRLKLGLALALVALGSTAAATALMFRLQTEALRASEAETLRLLSDGVRRVAQESLLAQDPLMLLDHLAHLRRERPEVAAARAMVSGTWREVGGPAKADAGPPVGIKAQAPDGAAAEAELSFSTRLLAERMAAARAELGARALRAGGLAAALGVVVAALLSAPLTGRILRIERAVAEIAEGKLGVQAEAAGSDEVARLARGVNAMSARLKELDELKRLFVASVTHELRSPLGAIQAQAAELIAAGGLAEGQAEMLGRVRRNAARLEHFVASLLEVAKIERGQLEYSPRRAVLGPIVEDAALFFAARAREAGLSMESRVEPGLPELNLDPDLMTQAVTNLISNAIKYTPKGGRVTVSAAKEGRAVEVAVADTGVGIAPEALARLFTPFERVKNPTGAPGVGLGLVITKSIIERHGGTLTVTSQPGQGSRFSFRLPVA